MAVTNWTDFESRRAQETWLNFQQRHDLTGEEGRTAGIDPMSGAVWIGDSIQDVVAQRDAEGINAPLYFVRVGSVAYYRKGGRR